jgi:thioredoxin 1
MNTTAVTERNFAAEVLNSDRPVLVEFWSGWRLMGAVLNGLAQRLVRRVKIVSVDLQKNPALNASYGINSLPSLLYFVNGNVRGKVIAPASKEVVMATLVETPTEHDEPAHAVISNPPLLRPDSLGLLPWRPDFRLPN